jgi:hypothetical protein
MYLSIKNLAATSAALMIVAGGAEASIVATSTGGGSEVLLNLVNLTNNSSYTLDLGLQFGDLGVGDTFALDANAQAFIAGAGGLANVDFALIAAATGTRQYLTTSASPSFLTTNIGNAVRGTWTNSINELIANLNAGDATATTVNNGYGPFATGPSPNYVGGGHDLWQGSVNNRGSALNPLNIYLVTFGTSTLGNAAKALFTAEPAYLSGTMLTIGQAVVPVPAAVWLFGSAIGLLGAARRYQQSSGF